MLLQDQGHPTDVFINLLKSPYLMLIDHIRDPDKSPFLGTFRKIPVNHVMNDIDFSIRVPSVEGRIRRIQDSFRELKPLN